MQMSEAEFEMRLTDALYRAAELDYMDMPSDDELEQIVQPSPRFQRRMQALLRNPHGYANRYRRPIQLRVLQHVAAVFIVFTLLLGTVMAVSPTVRAAVIDFVRSWFEDRTEYYTPENPIEDNWTFGYIPAGFELITEMTDELQLFFVYENEASERIFIYIGAGQEAVDNEHSVFYQTTANNRMADVYEAVSEGYDNIVVVYDEPTGVIITLISSIDVSELINIAENIS